VTQAVVTRTLQAAALLGFAALASVIIGMLYGGGAAPLQFSDPGPVVRWGQPIVKLVLNLSMATAIGTLVLSAFAGNEQERQRLQPVASWAAALWLGASAIYFLLTYLSASGTQLSYGPEFSEGLWLFATQIELGSLLAANVLIALVVSLSTMAFTGTRMVAVNAAIAAAGLYPLAESGHASSDVGHTIAVNSMLMHLVGISVWVGGLVALYSVFYANSERAGVLVSRYSTLALFAFILVAISGVTSGYIRLYEPSDLLSTYGLMLIGKSVLLIALGAFGALHRLKLVSEFTKKAKGFWKLVTLELTVMGLAMGLGTALALTPLPVSDAEFVPPTPAQLLTGDPLPPELTDAAWLTVWDPDPLWATVAVLGIALYLYGVKVLRDRGDKWPLSRTIPWVLGMVVLFYVTNGAPHAYQEYLFSVHMVGHMMLSMLVPVLLVPGAPVTLLSRAQAARTDGSRGLREWVLWAVHTPYAWFISQPIVAGLNFALSLVMFYYTPLFRWATEEHLGHQWMLVHFLIAFHAFFGLGLMNERGLLLADWFGSMGRTWGDDPLADQAVGGAFAWGVGELPTIVITLIVVTQWYRSDIRERKRLDRQADRTGNKELEEYNLMFEQLNKRDQR
jgi:cytochrome c oxidase assembly factor CtaG/putative copper export protein